MDRIRHLSDIPSMPRYSVGKVNTAELEAAVHLTPTSTDKHGKRCSSGSGRRLSNASGSGCSSAASIGAGSGSQSDESSSGAHAWFTCNVD